MSNFWIKGALCALVVSSPAFAQTSTEPSHSASVLSPTESTTQPVEPVKRNNSAKTGPETTDEADIVADPASLLPDLPRVPPANATLIGGVIAKLDRVRDQITLHTFGGGRTTVLFDPRTRVYAEGSKMATASDLREGQRVYVDTILDGSTVFARNIRLWTVPAPGESRGVVLNYRADKGEMTISDALSPVPVRLYLDSSTRFSQGDHTVPASTMSPGSLVTVTFDSDGDGHNVARDISILAQPRTSYTFTGQIVHLDLRTNLMVLTSATSHQTYEIYLDPSTRPDEMLRTGAVVTVVTNFEGSRYVARSLTIDSAAK